MYFDIFSTRLKARQRFFSSMLGLVAALFAPMALPQSLNDVVINHEFTVYKSETCGCCVGWISHMEAHGFDSEVQHPRDLNGVKEELGLLPKWQSCHTAVSKKGYLFEGHIPAKYIAQFLASPPEGALGLAVPGMPMGSPGMDFGDTFNAYEVLLINKDGSSTVFASIKSKADQ